MLMQNLMRKKIHAAAASYIIRFSFASFTLAKSEQRRRDSNSCDQDEYKFSGMKPVKCVTLKSSSVEFMKFHCDYSYCHIFETKTCELKFAMLIANETEWWTAAFQIYIYKMKWNRICLESEGKKQIFYHPVEFVMIVLCQKSLVSYVSHLKSWLSQQSPV